MEKRRPLILISNDDGYHAPGIKQLVEFVKPFGDVLVCAPESARSGYSCAFSVTDYLRLKPRHNMGDTEVWSCTGTPADCVKIALSQLCSGRAPALIIGGINHGDNSSTATHYSGTMGVAREGCMQHIPSIAFSSAYYNEDADLSPLRPYVEAIVRKVLADGLPSGICLNVNFPAAPAFKGVKVCRMSAGRWTNEIDKREHPRGYNYYWVVGEYLNDEPEATDTDRWAISHGYVSITPTLIDVTAYDFMKEVEGWEI